MNILLFVTSLLMILSLMTYARIDSFRYFLGMEAEFERYMSTIERISTNAAAVQWYKTTRAPKPKTNTPAPKPPANPKTQKKQGQSASRLSFRIFIDQKMRQDNPEAFKQTAEWAKRLMITLYGNQKFFIEAHQKNPTFMDQILESLERATEGLFTGKQKLTDVAQLSNLYLDESVAQVFYRMLKGCSNSELKADQPVEEEKEDIVKVPANSDNDQEEDTSTEAEEYSKEGRDSLLNYITLSNATRIRVYLASRALLAAMFGEVSVADSIIEARQALYRAVINESLTAEEATDQFADLLKGYMSNNDEEFLDFTVSRTNPAGYK